MLYQQDQLHNKQRRVGNLRFKARVRLILIVGGMVARRSHGTAAIHVTGQHVIVHVY